MSYKRFKKARHMFICLVFISKYKKRANHTGQL
nr:MAG TPA: hypothetical protein [Caudoviricetes sp.]